MFKINQIKIKKSKILNVNKKLNNKIYLGNYFYVEFVMHLLNFEFIVIVLLSESNG